MAWGRALPLTSAGGSSRVEEPEPLSAGAEAQAVSSRARAVKNAPKRRKRMIRTPFAVFVPFCRIISIIAGKEGNVKREKGMKNRAAPYKDRPVSGCIWLLPVF